MFSHPSTTLMIHDFYLWPLTNRLEDAWLSAWELWPTNSATHTSEHDLRNNRAKFLSNNVFIKILYLQKHDVLSTCSLTYFRENTIKTVWSVLWFTDKLRVCCWSICSVQNVYYRSIEPNFWVIMFLLKYYHLKIILKSLKKS